MARRHNTPRPSAGGNPPPPGGPPRRPAAGLPADTVIGLDHRYALELVQGSDVMVEYDKLIDRQLERAAITTLCGFAKLFPDASRVLKVKAAEED